MKLIKPLCFFIILLMVWTSVSFSGNLEITQEEVEIDNLNITSALTAVSAVLNSLSVSGETTGTPKIKVGLTNRDMSESSGQQTITGIGFKPKGLILLLVRNDHAEMAIGFSDGSNNFSFWDRHNAVANTWNTSSGLGLLYEAGSTYYNCTKASFIDDGFTLDWVKTGNKTGILQIIYFALG